MKLYDYFSILGFVRTRLFKVVVPSEFPRDSQNLEIRHKIDLPPDDTTYWCSTHKLPNVFKRKHHAVQVSHHLKKCMRAPKFKKRTLKIDKKYDLI